MAIKTPSIRVDLHSPVPVYRQIVDALRAVLVDGELAPGDALPPVRRVAMELGITFNTVAQAYRQLAEEGWLDLRHGRRAIVLDRRAPATIASGKVGDFRRRIREIVAEMRAQGMAAGDIAAELRLILKRLEV